MKGQKQYVVYLLLLFMISCSEPRYFQLSKKMNSEYLVRIEIAGPGDCGQLIFLDKDGKGVSMRGKIPVNSTEEFDHFLTIEKLDAFKISLEKDLVAINTLIEGISDSKKIVGNPRSDARRLKIFIGNVLKLDIYNVYANKFEQILIKLHPYIGYNIDEFCELR